MRTKEEIYDKCIDDFFKPYKNGRQSITNKLRKLSYKEMEFKAMDLYAKEIAIGFYKWLKKAGGSCLLDKEGNVFWVFRDKANGILDYEKRYTYEELYDLYIKTEKQ